MEWLKSHQRSAWICGLTLLVPVLLYLNALGGIWGMRAQYQTGIERLEPRIARLAGLKTVEADLAASAARVDDELTSLVYPAASDRASVSAGLQTGVRQLFREAGMSVDNSQVLPVRQEANFDYIGVKLTVSGDIASLDAALAEVADFSPLLLVEGLDVWPMRVRRDQPAGQRITANLRLLSLRAAL